MAAKNDTNIYNFFDDGTVFTYDRLAEDVLYYLYSEFGVKTSLIPEPRWEKNYYKKESTILFVSRQCKHIQIKLRSSMFDAFTESNAVERIGNDVTHLYQYFSELFEGITDFITQERKSFSSIDKFHTSFALLAELTLFCILENNPNVIKKTARTWVFFFETNLKKEFENDGGISEVLLRAEKTCYMDSFLLNFISAHCVPYKNQKLHYLYAEELQNSSLIEVTVGNSKEWISMSESHLAKDFQKPAETERFDPLRSVPSHDHLDLPHHEEVLNQSLDPETHVLLAEASSTDTYEYAIKIISLKEELKNTRKLPLSKATMLKQERSVTNVDASSATGTEEPETKSCDRVPASYEPSCYNLLHLLPKVWKQ